MRFRILKSTSDGAGRRRRITGLACAATLIAGATAMAGGVASAASPRAGDATSWAPTATQALDLANATAIGSVPAATPLSISVALNVQNASELATLAQDASTVGSPTYGDFLTPAQIAAQFAPSSATTSAVASWLTSAGFKNVSVSSDRLFVSGTAPAATAQKAFDTTLGLFDFNGQTVYANTEPAMVPTALAGEVLSVLGLSDVQLSLPLQVKHAGATVPAIVQQQIAKETAIDGTPYTGGFSPEQLATVYDAASLPSATKTSIAVLTSGDMSSTITDLRYAETQDGVAQAPVSVVYTAPKATIINNNEYTGNLEWDLDTQMSTGIAGDVAHEYIYDMPTLDDADVARAINMFVEQDKAIAGSASLGECDVQPYLDGTMAATDEVLEEGALQGQAFFASSGDNGYACPEVASTGAPGGVPGASWPADGTWTTAVGGTTLLATSSGQYEEELSWIGGGGGVSEFETPGNWTATADAFADAAEYLPMGGRGEPDIAADADDLVSPVQVYQAGAANDGVGGTSVASPLSLGIWARLQTVHQNKLGVASIDFYDLYNTINKLGTVPSDPLGFNDITIGTNGLWTALPGYDFTTGIGSLQASTLSGELGTGSSGSKRSDVKAA
ncbi:MAG: protease pro-enzyme activation domain-containing protein [Acidimicrobiales bacterium]